MFNFIPFIDSKEVNIVVMVGISGSGKTTIAQEIKRQIDNKKEEKNTVILSSDEIRKLLYNDENDQTHNGKVFDFLQHQCYKEAEDKHDVIIDATNLTLKNRKWIVSHFENKSCNLIACIIPTPIEECKVRNSQRERRVPEEIIESQARKFEVPFYEEGWNKIVIWGITDNHIYVSACSVFGDDIFDSMEGFDQKNSHHKYDLQTHCKRVASELVKQGVLNSPILRAAMIHDIGKLWTQAPKENSADYSYLQHHCLGAYYAITHWTEVAIYPYDFSTVDDLLECIFYINYHMQPFFLNTDKSKEKWEKIWGTAKYNTLLIFNECDQIGSGRIDE